MTWKQHIGQPALEGGGLSRRRFLKGATAALAATTVGLAGQHHALAAAARGLRAAQTQPVVSVTDPAFGARGDGRSNDRAAFQAAIDAAIQRGLPLWIPRPAQHYRVELDPEHSELLVHGDLIVIGEGRDSTLVRFSIPSPDPSKEYAGFYVRNGCGFQITECRIEEDTHPRDFEFHGFFFQAGTRDHLALIERIDVDGFTNIIMAHASGEGDGTGELFLAIREVDFKPDLRFCVAFFTAETGHKRLHIYDSFFHDNQESHLVYCHPHNSVHVENCRFDGATGWAFQLQGTAISGDPDYQRFIGCWFGTRNSRAIITHNGKYTHPRPEVRNCVFEAQAGVQIRSDVIIDGCYFTNARDAQSTGSFITAIDSAPWTAEIRNCIFAPKHDAMPHVDLSLPNTQVTLENCQFYHQGFGSMLSLGKGPTNVATVDNCLFYVRADDASQARFLEVSNGRNTVTNCRFHGRAPRDRGVVICLNQEGTLAGDAALQIDNCTFHSITSGSMFYILDGPGNSWSGRISGVNNRIVNWLSGSPLLGVEGATTPFYAQIAPVVGPAPLALEAAPVTVVSSNYDTYQVNGPGDIAALNWWTADGASNSLFAGTISLTAATPFALVSGGNIQLAGGATRRDLAAGTTTRLSYDSAAALWREQ